MTAKTDSSKTKTNPQAAIHPQQVVRDLLNCLEPFIASDEERRATELIAEYSLPPPGANVVCSTAELLRAGEIVGEPDFKSLLQVLERADGVSSDSSYSPVAYPVPYAMSRLDRKGASFGEDRYQAVKMLVKIVNRFDPSGPFTGIMLHKHVIAVRDVIEMYWDSFAEPDGYEAVCSLPFDVRIRQFIREGLESAVVSETGLVKLRQIEELIDGRLTLGGTKPREKIRNRARNELAVEVTPSDSFSAANPDSTYVQSARVHEPCPDDDHSGMDIDFPSASTPRDRCTISRQVRDGFARRNVRSVSDMSGCSRITYTDFLAYAERFADTTSFSLVWLSAIPAVDIRRPMAMKLKPRQRPNNDEILIDKNLSTIEYRVLRRKKKNDDTAWEACGLMCLPIPPVVAGGLVAMAEGDDVESSIKAAEALATKFGRTHAGTTPTTRRLRSSARMHFAPHGFTELQFGAISGLIPPGVRALSHYYHETVVGLQLKFQDTYEAVAGQWRLDLPTLPPRPKRPTGRRNDLLCLSSEPPETVQKTLNAIAVAYARDASVVSGVRRQADLEALVGAANRHSLALYMFQELAAGLRPTGNVARFTSAKSVSGSLTADKGSRAFSERSFSPLPSFHARLLEVTRQNREALQHGVNCLGIEMEDRERHSDLACWYTLSWEKRQLVRDRLTGQMHRLWLLAVPNIITLNRANNWLRKTIAQLISGSVPQWQADEFFGHRRCGREPTGHWSTASISHMRELEALLEHSLAPFVPESLYEALDV